MAGIFKATLMSALLLAVVTLAKSEAKADPEPTTMLLLGSGLLGIAGAVRKRFRSE